MRRAGAQVLAAPVALVAFVALSALMALVAAAAPSVASAAEATPPVRLQQVGPHTWYAQGIAALASRANRNFISNAGVIVTPAGLVFVDALGSPPLAADLLAAARALPGVSASTPVHTVIVTHYHADHIYGLQTLKAAGATVWAHARGREYLTSDAAAQRLAATRAAIAPIVDERTVLVAADRWLEGDATLELGDVRIRVLHAGPAHTAEDLVVHVEPDRVLYSGDLVFRNRIPFVGEADSRGWLAGLERLIGLAPRVLVPGHGPASPTPATDLGLTRDYLRHLRETMGRAVADFESFEDAYRAADWSRWRKLPLYDEAHRPNAYNTYLRMEREALAAPRR